MNAHAYLKGCELGHSYNEFWLKVIQSLAILKYSRRELRRLLKEEAFYLKDDLKHIWIEK